jgi:5''-3'' exonuclease, N-terminal resolvase-like domain.
MQLPVAIEWIDKMGYKTLGMQGYEADDMIANCYLFGKRARLYCSSRIT